MLLKLRSQPCRRRVGAVARVVLADEADAARLEACQAEKGDQIVVHRCLPDDLVVRGQHLRADEPVVLDPVQVAQPEGADVIFRLQGHTRPDEVVVVVPDQATDGDHVEPMLVGVERGSPEHHGGRRVGRGVLRADAEDRHLRLRIELADIAGERADRRAELRVVRERRQQQPGRRSLPSAPLPAPPWAPLAQPASARPLARAPPVRRGSKRPGPPGSGDA